MARETPPLRRDYADTAPTGAPRRGRLAFPRVRWRTAMVAILGVTLIAGAIAALNSPLMKIQAVDVRGTQHLTAEAIAQIAGLRGQHLLLADLAAARERILAQPLVKEVAISREWPNQVRVDIVERTPWARWEIDGDVFAIDAEGVVLEGLAAPPDSVLVRQASSLPIVRGGARVDLAALALIHRIEAAEPPPSRPRILAYEWSLRQGLTVVTTHGRITFGGADGFSFKYQVWRELEREAERRGEPLLTADLRFGTRPAVEIGLGLGRATRITEP